MSLSLSSHPRERDGSSVPLDDNIHRLGRFSDNDSINHLQLLQEVNPPKHEFVVLKTGFTWYRIERRPTILAGIKSMWRGCPTEDTITFIGDGDWGGIHEQAYRLFSVNFRHDPKPGLHTAFAISNAILKDPDAQKYTLKEFNCYFFARTLSLLIFRHFLIRQYCRIQKSPRNDFGNFPEPAIDAIADDAMSRMEGLPVPLEPDAL